MSKFNAFMKANKVVKDNVKRVATTSIVDENGNSPEWEFRHISTKENKALREKNVKEVPIPGKFGAFRQKIDGESYVLDMIVASTVVPNLYDAELQDSYGVKTPEDLLMAMIDNPGEYDDLAAFVQKFNGYNKGLDEKIEEAKN
ncbi:MAG: hypothetical protein Q4D26_07710 [Clostridia bacterium]|nr:hypothetical protein [Clostridia bacterium]